MVHYKRTPIQYQPDPPQIDDDTEVWHISATGEVFISYEAYLQRRDFYMQKKFTCDITGHTNLTYFEALESEKSGSMEVDNIFPDPLKEPILRDVQFATERFDILVNSIYKKYKKTFFPSERIKMTLQNAQESEGIIREKSIIPPAHQTGAALMEEYEHYFIQPDSDPNQIVFAKGSSLKRDRRVFTTNLVRSFLRQSLVKDSFTGRWTVQEKVAAKYRLPQNTSPDMVNVMNMDNRDPITAHKKAANPRTSNGSYANFGDFMKKSYPHNSPATNGYVNGNPEQESSSQPQYQQTGPHIRVHPLVPGVAQSTDPANNPYLTPNLNPSYEEMGSFQGKIVPLPLPARSKKQQAKHGGTPLQFNVPKSQTQLQFTSVPGPSGGTKLQLGQPSNRRSGGVIKVDPIPIKYPIEDLEIAPRRKAMRRPDLKFFTSDVPKGVKNHKGQDNALLMKSIGPLLTVWDILNVHDQIYCLASFTFDDFVDAMSFSSAEMHCELFEEIHCSVLKTLVDENGAIQMKFGKDEMESEESESDEENEESESSPEPEPKEARPPARSTRSSLAKAEASALKHQPVDEEDDDEGVSNLATEMLGERDWVERLKTRDFRNGGWQVVMVGLLRRLSNRQGPLRDAIHEILAHLAPTDMDPTQETARVQYSSLDINLRIIALELAVKRSITTNTFKEYLEGCAEEMTVIRKSKIEKQKLKKQLIIELKELDEERKVQAPLNMPPTPPATTAGTTSDASLVGIDEPTDITMSGIESDLDDATKGPTLRRANDRTAERKRKREVEAARREKEKKAKIEAAAGPKMSAKFKKLLRDLDKKKDEIQQTETGIEEDDNDLREANCQRLKMLGKDRFMNRYYWFERNGMPYGGMPDSSTANYGYANGRIWVQGPMEIELQQLLNPPEEGGDGWRGMKWHKAEFGCTPQELRDKEEGVTQLHDADQWGYYDDGKEVDDLISWLDERGQRERELVKELCEWRKPIVKYMDKMKEHLAEVDEKKGEGEGQTNTRVSTRTKTYVDLETTTRQCLFWTNTTAMSILKHLHSDDGPKIRRQKKLTGPKIPMGRDGKPLSRQGVRTR